MNEFNFSPNISTDEFDSPDQQYKNFRDTIPGRMDIYTARQHAKDSKSPFQAKAAERVRQLESDPAFIEQERLNSLSDEELLSEFSGLRNQYREAQSHTQAARNAQIFVRDHSEYKATPQNANNIDTYLKQNGLKPTVSNIERAAQSLAASGLLETNPIVTLPPPIRDFADGDEWGGVSINSYGEGDELL